MNTVSSVVYVIYGRIMDFDGGFHHCHALKKKKKLPAAKKKSVKTKRKIEQREAVKAYRHKKPVNNNC